MKNLRLHGYASSVSFVEEKEEWLQPKATIEAKGELANLGV